MARTNPRYLMVTGQATISGGSSAMKPADSLVYVADATTGNFAVYTHSLEPAGGRRESRSAIAHEADFQRFGPEPGDSRPVAAGAQWLRGTRECSRCGYSSTASRERWPRGRRSRSYLQQLELQPRYVAVEINLQLIPRQLHAQHVLQRGGSAGGRDVGGGG